jgi:hypothetical protein
MDNSKLSSAATSSSPIATAVQLVMANRRRRARCRSKGKAEHFGVVDE